MKYEMTITTTGEDCRPVENGASVCLVPERIRAYMTLTEFTVDTITAACDWSGDNYYPVGLSVTAAPADAGLSVLLTDARGREMRAALVDGSCELTNLYAGTAYTLRLLDADGADAAGPVSFTTTPDVPRTLKIAGIDNTRDIGGRLTSDGRRVKQGMVLRGSNLRNIPPEGLAALVGDLGVRTELDLTGGGESSDAVAAVMAREFHSIKWYNLIFEHPEDLPALRDALRLFADEANYPFYIHCSLGRDRTGAIAFFLNALCGVSDADLYREHLLTFFSRRGDGENVGVWPHLCNINGLYGCTMNVLGKDHTVRENVRAFLLSIGLTEEELDRIAEILTEDA